MPVITKSFTTTRTPGQTTERTNQEHEQKINSYTKELPDGTIEKISTTPLLDDGNYVVVTFLTHF